MKPNRWWHLAGWLVLYGFWVLVFQKRAFTFSQTLTVQFCYLLFIAANYYWATAFTIPRLLYRKQYIAFTGALLAGLILTAWLRVPLATYLNQHYFLVGKPQPGAVQLFQASLLNITIWSVCMIACKLIIDRFRFQQHVDAVEKERARAELDFLNAQFNPHFLFNAINSIYAHIDKHNSTARSMLLTFSEMLRYQLYDCNTPSISIDKEINYLKHYVAVQQSRKEDNLIVHLLVDESVKGFSIAPLLFIAFIENAFKYVGNSEETENSILISFHRDKEELFFKCFNTKEKRSVVNDDHQGIGVANAKRRIALLYPGKHHLAIQEEDGYYEVNLNIHLT